MIDGKKGPNFKTKLGLHKLNIDIFMSAIKYVGSRIEFEATNNINVFYSLILVIIGTPTCISDELTCVSINTIY